MTRYSVAPGRPPDNTKGLHPYWHGNGGLESFTVVPLRVFLSSSNLKEAQNSCREDNNKISKERTRRERD